MPNDVYMLDRLADLQRRINALSVTMAAFQRQSERHRATYHYGVDDVKDYSFSKTYFSHEGFLESLAVGFPSVIDSYEEYEKLATQDVCHEQASPSINLDLPPIYDDYKEDDTHCEVPHVFDAFVDDNSYLGVPVFDVYNEEEDDFFVGLYVLDELVELEEQGCENTRKEVVSSEESTNESSKELFILVDDVQDVQVIILNQIAISVLKEKLISLDAYNVFGEMSVQDVKTCGSLQYAIDPGIYSKLDTLPPMFGYLLIDDMEFDFLHIFDVSVYFATLCEELDGETENNPKVFNTTGMLDEMPHQAFIRISLPKSFSKVVIIKSMIMAVLGACHFDYEDMVKVLLLKLSFLEQQRSMGHTDFDPGVRNVSSPLDGSVLSTSFSVYVDQQLSQSSLKLYFTAVVVPVVNIYDDGDATACHFVPDTLRTNKDGIGRESQEIVDAELSTCNFQLIRFMDIDFSAAGNHVNAFHMLLHAGNNIILINKCGETLIYLPESNHYREVIGRIILEYSIETGRNLCVGFSSLHSQSSVFDPGPRNEFTASMYSWSSSWYQICFIKLVASLGIELIEHVLMHHGHTSMEYANGQLYEGDMCQCIFDRKPLSYGHPPVISGQKTNIAIASVLLHGCNFISGILYGMGPTCILLKLYLNFQTTTFKLEGQQLKNFYELVDTILATYGYFLEDKADSKFEDEFLSRSGG